MVELNEYGEVFSKVYDRYWNEFLEIIAPQIKIIYTKMGYNGKILDLCCGTGRLVKYLSNQNISVIGIDKSRYMLEIAKKRNLIGIQSNKVELIEQDAVSFSVESKMCMVVSVFDSMNHIKDMTDLERCFINVRNSLEEGGVFLFDLNTKKGLIKWKFIDIEVDDDLVLIMHGDYKEGNKRAYTQVFGFIKGEGNCYQKFDETMYNTIFSIQDVIALLKGLGWSEVYCTKEDNMELQLENPENYDRVFIIAKL
ncbi:MAG: class I SAM-dependent methyltransferase [Candidatus Heimdallarchaeota archaeon]|nr:class I SAM-dependent methyltransferase [Candidatus Heimdallarchaeota archaeon]MDH5647673.1 class I SAM-dependent methyltransferase [Candidatus Heimdallarchaeota archaeon]